MSHMRTSRKRLLGVVGGSMGWTPWTGIADENVGWFDGSTLGAVDSDVTEWQDRGPNGHHLGQNIEAQQPLVKMDPKGNGVKCIWTSGAGESLRSVPYYGGSWGSDDYTGVEEFTVAVGIYSDPVNGDPAPLDFIDHNRTQLSLAKIDGSYTNNGVTLRSYTLEGANLDISNGSAFGYYGHGAGYNAWSGLYQLTYRVTGADYPDVRPAGMLLVVRTSTASGSVQANVRAYDDEGYLERLEAGATAGSSTVGQLSLWADGGGNGPLEPQFMAFAGAWIGWASDDEIASLATYANENFFGGNLGVA